MKKYLISTLTILLFIGLFNSYGQALISRKGAKITPLPFGKKIIANGSHFNAYYYCNLIYGNFSRLVNDGGFTEKTKKNIIYYQLPIIKKAEYIRVLGTEPQSCLTNIELSKYLNKKQYRYRLPDFHTFSCYYFCNYDPYHKEMPKEAKTPCQPFFYDAYGYLIMYDSVSATAHVLTVFYDTFGGDALSYQRLFYIDKNFNISLTDFSIDEHDVSLVNMTKIKLGTNGEFIIKQIK
jgi:hypothetical protein